MSLTSTVPSGVPSLFHSSWPRSAPVTGSRASALKKSVPPTRVRRSRVKPLGPGGKSLSMTVPASVPSLFHSWRPKARKKSVSPTRVRLSGVDEPAPGLMSLTSLAPEFGFAGWAGATDTVARRKQIGATRSACSLTNALIIALLSVRDEPDVKDEPHQSTATHGTRRVVGLAF